MENDANLSLQSPPPASEGQPFVTAPVEAGLTLVERLRQYRGESFETSECYNGLREDAATRLDAQRAEIGKLNFTIESLSAEVERLLTADRENSELLEAAIEGQSYWQARAERVEGAAQAVIDRMSSTYKARNGREVGIQGEDGEKCYIVHSDEIHALEAVLADAQQTQKPEPGSNEWLSRSPNFHPGDIA